MPYRHSYRPNQHPYHALGDQHRCNPNPRLPGQRRAPRHLNSQIDQSAVTNRGARTRPPAPAHRDRVPQGRVPTRTAFLALLPPPPPPPPRHPCQLLYHHVPSSPAPSAASASPVSREVLMWHFSRITAEAAPQRVPPFRCFERFCCCLLQPSTGSWCRRRCCCCLQQRRPLQQGCPALSSRW